MVDLDTSVRAGGWYTPYTAVLASRVRAQRAYPLSFATDLFSALVTGLAEFAEVWVIFHNIRELGGLTLVQMLVLFGLSNTAFALADMMVGHIDTLPAYIRTGTLDAFHVRPQPLLLQLITSDISLRRIARVAVAATVLAVGLALNPIGWSPAKVALLVITIPSGAAIFAALFVAAAGLQFFLLNGAETVNSFTYGGSFAAQQPGSIFPIPLRLLFGVAVPVAFTAYLDADRHPGPHERTNTNLRSGPGPSPPGAGPPDRGGVRATLPIYGGICRCTSHSRSFRRSTAFPPQRRRPAAPS